MTGTSDYLSIMVAVEDALRATFERRYTGSTMSYEQTRELVWLEMSIKENIAIALKYELGFGP